MNANQWYAVRLVFESLHPEEPELDPFFEERIILVRASTEDAARSKASKHASSEEHEYKNAYEKKVVVVFKEVLDVRGLLDEEVTEFTEVYSQFLNATELDQIRKSLEPGSADERWPATAAASATPPRRIHTGRARSRRQ